MLIMILGFASIFCFFISLCLIVVFAVQKKKLTKPLLSLLICFTVFVFCISAPDDNTDSTITSETNAPTSSEKLEDNEIKNAPAPTAITFSGENYAAEYLKCWNASGVNGCFYIDVKITNTGDKECAYLLDDVYVDDTHCQSGSGLPITALPSKNVKASFVVFCETPLSEISKVEFKLNVLNSENYNTIETSDLIFVTPNS